MFLESPIEPTDLLIGLNCFPIGLTCFPIQPTGYQIRLTNYYVSNYNSANLFQDLAYRFSDSANLFPALADLRNCERNGKIV